MAIIKIKPNIKNFKSKVISYTILLILKACQFLGLALTYIFSKKRFLYDIVCEKNNIIFIIFYFLVYFLFEFCPILISISFLRPINP